MKKLVILFSLLTLAVSCASKVKVQENNSANDNNVVQVEDLNLSGAVESYELTRSDYNNEIFDGSRRAGKI